MTTKKKRKPKKSRVPHPGEAQAKALLFAITGKKWEVLDDRR